MSVGAPARPEPAPGDSPSGPTADARHAPEPEGPFTGALGRWFLVAAVATVIVGVALRFVTRSDLWLDEALTVNIAKRPLDQLGHLLRRDGAPPLYYVLLHGWISVFGSGDLAVRSLSGVMGLLTLPLAWLAGARLGGPSRGRRVWVATAVLLVVAASPYAVRYATEARMYELEILLVLLGYLAVWRAFERPTAVPLLAVAVVTCALLYTQYWAFYLVAVVAAGLAWRAWRGRQERRAARDVLIAIAVGCLGFVPWLPTFAYQLAHTGTPWAHATIPPSALSYTLTDFGGGSHWEAWVLALPFVLLPLLALFGVAVDRIHVDLDLRTRFGVRWEWVVGMGTLALGFTASFVADSAYQSRYAALVFPFFALAVAFGITVFASRAIRYGALAILVVFGFVGGARNVLTNRTQAVQLAAEINDAASPGDVVAYCPDQIGPDVSRLLKRGLRQGSFPGFHAPELVDWVDYGARNTAADPKAFARDLVAKAGPTRTIWLAYASGYLTLGDKCEAISRALATLRPSSVGLVTEDDEAFFEHEGLLRYAP